MKVAEKEVEFESLEEEYGRLSARFTDLEAMLLRTQVSLEQNNYSDTSSSVTSCPLRKL